MGIITYPAEKLLEKTVFTHTLSKPFFYNRCNQHIVRERGDDGRARGVRQTVPARAVPQWRRRHRARPVSHLYIMETLFF